jgi:hypothetical protein
MGWGGIGYRMLGRLQRDGWERNRLWMDIDLDLGYIPGLLTVICVRYGPGIHLDKWGCQALRVLPVFAVV